MRNVAQWNELWTDPDEIAVGCLDDLLDRQGEVSAYLLDGIEIDDIAAALAAASSKLDNVHCLILERERLGEFRVELDGNGDTGSRNVNARHCTIHASTVGQLRRLTAAAYAQVKDGRGLSPDAAGQYISLRRAIAAHASAMQAADDLAKTGKQESPDQRPTWEGFWVKVAKLTTPANL